MIPTIVRDRVSRLALLVVVLGAITTASADPRPTCDHASTGVARLACPFGARNRLLLDVGKLAAAQCRLASWPLSAIACFAEGSRAWRCISLLTAEQRQALEDALLTHDRARFATEATFPTRRRRNPYGRSNR